MTGDSVENEQSLLTDAWEFFMAASELHVAMISKDPERGHLFGPTSYLIGHSLELVMKSVLAAKGCEISYLKKLRPHHNDGIGHDLDKAAKRIVDLNLGELSNFVEANREGIAELNLCYNSKRFEYTKSGWIKAPHQASFLEFLKRLIVLAKPIVEKRYGERSGLFGYSGTGVGYF